jgi:hypothetical protein
MIDAVLGLADDGCVVVHLRHVQADHGADRQTLPIYDTDDI